MFQTIERLKQEGKKIGFTASTSDLGQPGLLIMLEQLKSECDFVVFGLLSDPTIDRPNSKNFPAETLFERWIRMSSCKFIDMIIPFSTEKDLENMIKIIKPDIRYCGEEYKNDMAHTGRNIEGVTIVYNERKHDFSTSNLRKRIYVAETKLNSNSK
jgi:glycerol-3-phosphate cytidylyltransferase